MNKQKKTHSGHDDIPSADPQIQKDYEAALGAFLVVFNLIENTVNDVIVMALQQSERQDILQRLKGDSFSRKLATLDLISLTYSQPLPKTLVDELRDLSTHRNNFAHGHFDQNPFDGDYKIVTDRKKKLISMPIAQLNLLTERAETACDAIGYAQAFFEFYNLAAEKKVFDVGN